MSAYVFVSVAGGSLGLLAGGFLTQALSWHWVFFVNLPIGVATFALGRALIRDDSGLGLEHGVDWIGSLLVTGSLMSAIYAIVEVTSHGWTLLGRPRDGRPRRSADDAFLVVEARIPNPIMPLRILRLRGLVNASLVRGFLVTGMYSTFFLGTLYLEHVRHYSALETGAAFLPWTITVAILSQGITARLVARFGPLPVLTAGMASAAAGLLLFATVGPTTAYFPTIFVACFAIGLGIGNAFMPLLTLAMADVPPADAGLGSGITNVSQQISGALGLAVLSTIAANHTKGLLAADHGLSSALIGGYQLAFVIGAVTIAVGIVLAFALLRPPQPRDRSCNSPTHRPSAGPSASPPSSPWRNKPHDPRPSHPLRTAQGGQSRAQRARAGSRLVSEGVLASYIHDISARPAVGWPATQAGRSAMRSGHAPARGADRG
jgi:MFS family permease